MINTEPNRDHQYSLRSCFNCKIFDNCISKYNVQDNRIHCDFAKYGCVHYQGEYSSELSKAEILGINKDLIDEE